MSRKQKIREEKKKHRLPYMNSQGKRTERSFTDAELTAIDSLKKKFQAGLDKNKKKFSALELPMFCHCFLVFEVNGKEVRIPHPFLQEIDRSHVLRYLETLPRQGRGEGKLPEVGKHNRDIQKFKRSMKTKEWNNANRRTKSILKGILKDMEETRKKRKKSLKK